MNSKDLWKVKDRFLFLCENTGSDICGKPHKKLQMWTRK